MALPFMARSDKRAWTDATTFADLGALMAAWLEGRLGSRPGYAARFGPDDETRPLIPTLATACRAGYLTECSQPGYDGRGYDGARWRQRAGVEGFVHDPRLVGRITAAATRAGLLVVTHKPGDRSKDYTPVTMREDELITCFGSPMPQRDLKTFWSGAVGQTAFADLASATQLAIIDPTWGPGDRLWRMLAGAVW
ncbi:DUF6919 domain-containing protein [Streptomyces sp. DW26H14]|uniref:DUF6919 domain-containing protein n=1 Tax=Streptomyces sp. DW26H14 TaxID=3435395 RepID=UPI00403DE863